MSHFGSFGRDRRGNVAMLFALAIIPLVGMVGAAIDYSRVAHVRTELADVLDAAVLSVGSRPAMTDKQAYDAVREWVDAHMTATAWTLDSVSQIDGRIIASASADVDMTIARILGVDQVPVSIQSEAVRSLGKIELVMVLDNTGSMKGKKIATLRDAADKLVDSLAAAAARPGDLRVGLVPFSQTVNVGPRYVNAAWIDAAGRSTSAKNLFLGQEVNRFGLFAALGTEWGGCVETRAMPWEASGAPPDPARPDTLYVPYFAPDEPGGKGSRPYNNSYLDDRPLAQILRSLGLSSATAPLFQYQQGDPFKYSGRPYNGKTGAFGYEYGPNSGCEMAPLHRLSTDTAAVKKAIGAMIANGNTDIPVGLAWGGNVLSPEGPFGDGAPYGDSEWTKTVVLMTDGNNENAEGNDRDESYYSGVGYVWQGRMGITSGSKSRRTAIRDARLGEMCAAMKAKGVVIYTVRVEVRNGSSSVLEDCASDADKFYDVQNIADLVAVFDDIGGSIKRLRLAR